MLRIHLFSIFIIKTPRTLAALAPFICLLIVKTLKKYSNYYISEAETGLYETPGKVIDV